MRIKQFLPLYIVLISFGSAVNALPSDTSPVMQRIKSNYEFDIGVAKDQSKYEFQTPAGGSILTYDKMKNNQGFIGFKYKHFLEGEKLNYVFAFAEGNFGDTRSGEVRDDDIRNVTGAYSSHDLRANNNQQHIGFGYAFDLSQIAPKFGNHILSFNFGYFKKHLSTRSIGNNYYSYADADYTEESDQISRSNFHGLAIGAKIEKIIDDESSISLAMNGLITKFGANNYWRARGEDWQLNQGGGYALNGFDLKTEYLTNVAKNIDLSIFGYYQSIKAKNLAEHSFGEWQAQAYPGYAETKSYGLGLGFKFF